MFCKLKTCENTRKQEKQTTLFILMFLTKIHCMDGWMADDEDVMMKLGIIKKF